MKLVSLSASLLALCATIPSAVAQISASAPVLYRLEAATSMEEGCQAPCMCPIAWTDDVFGTMTVQFDHSAPNWFDYYVVSDVNWIVNFGGVDRVVTGRGVYRVGGPVALTHELTLELSTDGGAPIHYESGLVPTASAFPVIDIAIARNAFFCFDTVFHLRASPVPAGSSVKYGLANSDYLVGCLPPCLCPITQHPVTGGFQLLELDPATNPLRRYFAVLDLRWRTLPAPAPRDRTFRGFGLYVLDAGATQHRMVAQVLDGNGTASRYDSGLVTGGLTAPMRIDVDLAVNGFTCFDQVLQLDARRR